MDITITEQDLATWADSPGAAAVFVALREGCTQGQAIEALRTAYSDWKRGDWLDFDRLEQDDEP